MTDHPRVVILGAGFGGLWAARSLSRTRAEVTLLDRNNYHTFLPLLYQVAAAELSPEDIVYPVRSILRKSPNVQFLLSEIQQIDFSTRTVETNVGAIVYDYLILAMGSVTHFFGVPGAARHAFQLKTLEQGIELRNQVLGCFERALHEKDAESRRRLLTFTIVGGGPTGVEFAGALAELIRGPLRKDFRQLDFGEVRIVLLDAAKAPLSGFPEKISAYVEKRLRRMRIELRVGTLVSEVTGDSVRTKDGTVLPTDTVIWTAGVRGDPMAEHWGLTGSAGGRIQVLPTLQVADHPEVYVIGDLALVGDSGRQLPMIAPAAIQQGETAAQNILRVMKGEMQRPFHYTDLGAMVTIGRNAAVASVAGFAVTGFAAWIVWLTVHIAKLIGFRNRLQVLINWAWDYLFYERAVRLILPLGSEPGPGSKQEIGPKA